MIIPAIMISGCMTDREIEKGGLYLMDNVKSDTQCGTNGDMNVSDIHKSITSGVLTKHEIDKYGLIKRLEKSGELVLVDSNKIQATT